jgi:alpha-mannosidase
MLLFGHGDGGGGPAVSHLEKLRRLSSCQAMPRIHMTSTPDDFFLEVRKDFDLSTQARSVPHPIWRGELYLELHQGTFTSQATIKCQNRSCETSLRGLEALHAMVVIGTQRAFIQLTEVGRDYLSSLGEIITSLWKDTLLNQFHDVIRESFLLSFVTPFSHICWLTHVCHTVSHLLLQLGQASPWCTRTRQECSRMSSTLVRNTPTSS